MDIPKIISVDDHVVEPQDLWTARLPKSMAAEGPRVERIKGRFGDGARGGWVEDEDESGEWADIWKFGKLEMALIPGFASAGMDLDEVGENYAPLTYDQMRPGCYEQSARLADMAANHTDSSLNFPTFPRFCGQTFHEHPDREMALECVRIYNDWMIDEWCAGAGYGKLIPMTLIPLWDPQLAAEEVRRCAAKGSFAVAFSENPAKLKLPSIFKGHWDPFFEACDETGTVVNLHIGSSSTFPLTSLDAPRAVSLALTYQGSSHALADWLTCGVLEKYKNLKVALSEGQIGWIPFLVEKLDRVWMDRPKYGNIENLPKPPSEYIPGRIYGCVFDDTIGLELRDKIGMDQIMFEVDYPHGDSTWPNTLAVLERMINGSGMNEQEVFKFVRGNAIECFGLDRFGVTV